MLMVNYRGSIGAGQDNVEFLLGRIGDADVKDVHHATMEALKQFPFLNPDKMVLFGGSHGGFLVTHMSGQFPVSVKEFSFLILNLKEQIRFGILTNYRSHNILFKIIL